MPSEKAFRFSDGICPQLLRRYTKLSTKIVLLSTCFLTITNGRHILLAKITDAPVKAAQDKNGETVGTRYFDQGLATHWIYIFACLLLIIVVLLLVVIILIIRRDRKTKEQKK